MKHKQTNNSYDQDALELILCKVSSTICETERLCANFNELKKRYLKTVRELNLANETNELLKKEIGNLRCREAALMGHIRQTTEVFGEEELDERLIN